MTIQDALLQITTEYKALTSEKPKVIVIAGPTASGKTSLAISVARELNGEIISADSMQIYKKMDIGTAKPTAEEQSQAVHHMIDMIEPWQEYSVAEYCEEAKRVIDDVLGRGKTPVIAGGTGLYISSLVNGISFSEPTENELIIHEEIMKQYSESGIEPIYDELRKYDPVAAEEIHINNQKRVIRALELYKSTGLTRENRNILSRTSPADYEYLVYVLNPDREKLYERINRRCDIMIESGLLEEKKALFDYCSQSYISKISPIDCPGKTAIQAIGYKEFDSFSAGEKTLDECVEELKMNSRRYAKRQFTWFRRMENATFLTIEYDDKNKKA